MIDEREAADVRDWLATADTADVRLDLGRTMEAGRAWGRRRRIAQVAGAGALALALLAGIPGVMALVNGDGTDNTPAAAARTPPPDGPFSCTFQALPAPPGVETSTVNIGIEAIDPSGRYVIAQASPIGNSRGDRKAVLWDNGVGQVLPPTNARPTAVSENGVVAGRYMRDPGGAWVYRNGTVTDIPTPAGAGSVEIVGIDKDGNLLGSVSDSGTMKVALWRADDLANPEYLKTAGESAGATMFLSDGFILGYGLTDRKLYVWNGARQLTTYTPPAGADDPKTVLTIDGWAYATGHRPNMEEQVAVRWLVGTGQVEWPAPPTVTPAADSLMVRGIARNGAFLYSAASVSYRMFVVRGDHVAQLPTPDGLEAYAEDMNEFGTKIAGKVSAGTNTREGLSMAVWTC